jgi:ATP-binding cassette subfamily C protein
MILTDVSFSLAAGQMVGVVGPSGAGKSTLARVLAGAMRPDRGVVRIDQAAMTDWDEEVLARHIGYMPQDFVLFAGTVKDNIARFEGLLNPDSAAIDAAAVAAAQAAGAHAMILHLPKGYDTVIGVNGSGLSSGQAQRIALARALYREPRILVLDEPNAHLDADGEGHLAELLARLKAQGRTIVVVAHRNSILAAADRILVLRDGRVAAFGTLAEMLADAARAMEAAAAPAAPDAVRKRA